MEWEIKNDNYEIVYTTLRTAVQLGKYNLFFFLQLFNIAIYLRSKINL